MSYASPDFRNTTAGVSGDLYVGSTLVGILDKVSVKKGSETLDLRKGTPRVLWGRIPMDRSHIIKAGVLEGKAENVEFFAGTEQLTAITGSPVTQTAQPLTMAAVPGSNLQAVTLDGPGATSITVTNTGGGTTYTAGTDYIVDAPSIGINRIWRNPAGAISSLQALKVTYTYTPVTAKRLLLGSTSSITFFTLANVRFEHNKPTDGGLKRIHYMWKAQCKGDLELLYEDDKYQILEPEIEALFDSSHPTCPYGYWEWQD